MSQGEGASVQELCAYTRWYNILSCTRRRWQIRSFTEKKQPCENPAELLCRVIIAEAGPKACDSKSTFAFIEFKIYLPLYWYHGNWFSSKNIKPSVVALWLWWRKNKNENVARFTTVIIFWFISLQYCHSSRQKLCDHCNFWILYENVEII